MFTIYTSEKTRIDSLRNTIRDEQEERQIANDYANVQRRLVNAASRLLLNMRDPSVERALIMSSMLLPKKMNHFRILYQTVIMKLTRMKKNKNL